MSSQEFPHRGIINLAKLGHDQPGGHLRADIPEVSEGERPPVASPEEGSHPEVEQPAEEGTVGVGTGLAGLQVFSVSDFISEEVEEKHEGSEAEVDDGEVKIVIIVTIGLPLSGLAPQLNSSAETVNKPEYQLGPRGYTAVPGE